MYDSFINPGFSHTWSCLYPWIFHLWKLINVSFCFNILRRVLTLTNKTNLKVGLKCNFPYFGKQKKKKKEAEQLSHLPRAPWTLGTRIQQRWEGGKMEKRKEKRSFTVKRWKGKVLTEVHLPLRALKSCSIPLYESLHPAVSPLGPMITFSWL